MTKIKAIFFDQDNTLLKTKEAAKPSYKYVFKYIASENDLEFEQLYHKWKEVLEVIKHSKNPNERKFYYSLSKVLEFFDLPNELAKEGAELFESKYVSRIELTKGTEEFFNKENNLIKLVFTESHRSDTEKKLGKFDLDKKVDLVLTCSDFGVMKPDISYLEYGWNKFNLKPNECIYIGDNWEKDCEIGQKKGGIGIVFGSEDERADYNISDMTQLLQILTKLNR